MEDRIGEQAPGARAPTFIASLWSFALSSRVSFRFSSLISCSRKAGVSGSDAGSDTVPLSSLGAARFPFRPPAVCIRWIDPQQI
jgi:hypothetical protein